MKPPRQKVLVSWSGGKDSAMALWETLRLRSHEVVALVTTITEDYDRGSMHGVRRVLLEEQADSIGLPLERVPISKVSSNEEYESRMRALLERYKEQGIERVVFGDIFLEDLRRYREKRLSEVGMRGIFPLWGRDTTELARGFIQSGFKAVVTCVDSEQMDPAYAGRAFDERMLASLPAGVDPCGENGEFHSFVYDGPLFRRAILWTRGEVVQRENRFYFCDLIPGAEHAC